MKGSGSVDDKKIIDLFWQRDEQAIAATERAYGGYCRAIADNILHDAEDAAECVNDALLHAWNSIPPHSPENLKAFLGKLTRCICLNRWRDARAAKRGGGQVELAYEELEDCISGGGSVDERLQAKELTQIINCFLASLPEIDRMLFVCRYWYFESVSQIANRFGFGQSKVKTTLWRLRRKLLETLKREGVFDE